VFDHDKNYLAGENYEYCFKMYKNSGFKVISEREDDYLVVLQL
jgi:hypothetical protein